jgi:serine phosphatase RsbU (regulator of sigma subunit)
LIIEEKSSPILIGLSEKVHDRNFTLKKIKLQENDWVFVYTDGFVDQFGGGMNKKYLKKQFLKLLSDNSHSDGANYSEQLNNAFLTWKGASEQIDDVLVLGLKV